VKRIGTSGAKAIARGNTNVDTNFTIKSNIKEFVRFSFIIFFFFSYSQDRDLLESSIPERFPVFPHCENREGKD
jgi:hypothetical protein